MLTDRPDPTVAPLPTGTVTFLFTDIEGSTRLVQELGARYGELLDRHRSLIEAAVREHRGRTFGSEGDALFAAFPDAGSALQAAVGAQRALQAEAWPEGREIRVRMGVHTGDAALSGTDYVGLTLHQVARIMAAGHGDEVIVSSATRALALTALPPDVELRDLGEHRLKDLANAERLYQLVAPGLRDGFPPPRTLSIRPNNLPLQVTSFIGRDEIDAASKLLATTRLLTLSGPGGTGKTRLALQLGAEAMDAFPDGVFFIALDSVDDPLLVPSAIAQALGIDVGSDPPLDRVVAYLRDKRALLVLDNFEQVVDAATVVGRLLRETAGIKAIVTSRVILRVYGEQEFPVPPLGLPPSDGSAALVDVARSEAVRLFVERAMASVPSFRLDEANAAAVADIVTRLDGLPLAIELAAARIRLLPVEALRSRLDQRLAVLTGGARDLPARQQTLRGAIDWSFDLLDAPDRRLFARLAVFAGGSCLPEAELVCGPGDDLGRDVLDGLLSLTEKSLIRSVPGEDGEPRFVMLATIREYGLERLDGGEEADAIRRRHALAYLALIEGCSVNLTGRDSGPWLDRLTLDHDNLRAAIEWAMDRGEAELAYRFGTSIWRFWQLRGHLDEAHARFPRILATAGGDDLPAEVRSKALGAAGGVEYWRGDEPETHRLYTAALEAARASGDKRLIAESLYNLGFGSRPRFGDADQRYTAGRRAWEESLVLFNELGDTRGIAGSTWALAIAELTDRNYDRAREMLTRSRELYRQLDDAFGLAWAYHMTGLTDVLEGQAAAAEASFREAMELFARAADQGEILLTLLDYASAARIVGDWDRRWRLGGAASRLRRSSGAGLADVPFMTEVDWSLTELPNDEASLRSWREGETLTTEEAVRYALEGSTRLRASTGADQSA